MRVERQVLFWSLALVLLLLAVGLLKDILLPFVAGIVIAYFLNPLADKLTAAGMSRTLASALIVAGAAVLLAVILVLVMPVLADQARELAAALPGAVERLKGVVETWARDQFGPYFQTGIDRATDALGQNWASLAGWAASSLWSGGMALFNFASLFLVTPLVVFYLLEDWHPMLDRIDGWLPRDHAPQIRALATDMNDAVAAFIRGQGTVCLVLGAFYALALSLAGLKYGLLIGIVTGLLAFIPFVGWALGLITAMISAAAQFWPDVAPMAVVGGVYLAGMAFDSAVLSPKIVGSKIGLHPVWLIFALFAFSYLFGFVGVLVAVPVAAAIGVLVRFALQVYLSSGVYKGEASR